MKAIVLGRVVMILFYWVYLYSGSVYAQEELAKVRGEIGKLDPEIRRGIEKHIELFTSKDCKVSRKAKIELAKKYGKQAIPLLIESLYDESSYIRGGAIEVLSYLRAKEALPYLEKMMNDPNRYAPLPTVTYLQVIGGEKAHELLRKMAQKEKDPNILFWVGVGLAQYGDKECIPILIEVLDKQPPAQQVLVKVTGQKGWFSEDYETAQKKWKDWWKRNKDTFELKEKWPPTQLPKF